MWAVCGFRFFGTDKLPVSIMRDWTGQDRIGTVVERVVKPRLPVVGKGVGVVGDQIRVGTSICLCTNHIPDKCIRSHM
jgi:hypothetical protein